jgi:uncharacterized protein YjbI with pentapeptide repeats
MAVLLDPGRSRAVLVGASTYSHLEDLPSVRDNLTGFRDVLVSPALGGLPADNCTILAEPAEPVDIYRALLEQATAAEDTLLVYFAGHGRTGSRNELWLCLPDTDPDELPYSAWPYDELRRVVADSRATKKVVILDCCFSGRALADQAGDEETILGQVGIEGTYILTAAAANAVALALPGERYTAFTGALLDLLNKGIPGGPELLTFAQIYPRLQYSLISHQLPRPRQQGSDTIAHLALTRNVAYIGRARTGGFSERFAVIAAQLGDGQTAVRLAGVHAMEGLADDWEENRQTCIDVLCAHLRLPYDSKKRDDADPAERTAYRANREVRHTVIRVINAHLQADAPVSWQGLDYDFTGVVFDGGNFRDAEFSGGTVSFADAKFSGGEVSFGGGKFSGGRVDFVGAEFSGGRVDFADAKFSGGEVSFGGAEFSGGRVDFADAMFHGAAVGFEFAEFSVGAVDFLGAEFSGGQVRFAGAKFSGATVGFGDAEFSGGTVSFRDAGFSGGQVRFAGARFADGQIGFQRARFSGGQVSFRDAEFSGATVGFGGARFSDGQVDFGDAEFSGGQVSFGGTVFSGGRVDFSGARRWSHPPMFNWDGKPPEGVVLPVQPS